LDLLVREKLSEKRARKKSLSDFNLLHLILSALF
jgi:hypothetical protein